MAFFSYHGIVDGNHVVRIGNATSSVTRMTSQRMKGMTPRMTELVFRSLATPAMTNRFMPIGGYPISTYDDDAEPDRVEPSASKTNGTVSRIMDSASMKQPSTK